MADRRVGRGALEPDRQPPPIFPPLYGGGLKYPIPTFGGGCRMSALHRLKSPAISRFSSALDVLSECDTCSRRGGPPPADEHDGRAGFDRPPRRAGPLDQRAADRNR